MGDFTLCFSLLHAYPPNPRQKHSAKQQIPGTATVSINAKAFIISLNKLFIIYDEIHCELFMAKNCILKRKYLINSPFNLVIY
jgi:hypothetical protein